MADQDPMTVTGIAKVYPGDLGAGWGDRRHTASQGAGVSGSTAC